MPARPFESLELLQLLKAASPGRERALYFLLATSGMRVNECLSLRWGSVLSASYEPLAYISAPLSKRKSGPLKRLIPLATCCIPDLLSMFPPANPASPTDFVFCSPGHPYRPLTTRHASRILFHRLKSCGFPPGLSTHSFRKWLARQIYIASGKDVSFVQIVLGHRSPSSTMYYLSPDSRRLRHCWSRVLCSVFGSGFGPSVDDSCDIDFKLALNNVLPDPQLSKSDPVSVASLLHAVAPVNITPGGSNHAAL